MDTLRGGSDFLATRRALHVPPRIAALASPFPNALCAAGGYWFRCDLRDSISREVCFSGLYEPQETLLLKHLLQPGMTFVDVGANWGYHTLVAASRVGPTGRVVSLEPEPRLFATLSTNISDNRLTHVTTLPLAASDTQGTFPLAAYEETSDNWGVSRLVSNQHSQSLTWVTAQSLDSVLNELGIDHIDLLKMDIEGGEEAALKGLTSTLTRGRIARILLELHPVLLTERGSSAAKVLELMRDHGYRAWWIDHSQVATRRVAYARSTDPRTLLRPVDITNAMDPWPHVLLTAPWIEKQPLE